MGQIPTDPVEQVVFLALTAAKIEFVNGEDVANNLDFYLPIHDLYIEVKRMYSPRIAEQMARADNVIAIQGMRAAVWFEYALRGGYHS